MGYDNNNPDVRVQTFVLLLIMLLLMLMEMMMMTSTALISSHAGYKKIIILCSYPAEVVGGVFEEAVCFAGERLLADASF